MATKKNSISQEVTDVMDEVKETAQDVGWRWKKASIEERICTCIGILVFARGLRVLKHLIWGIILLLIGWVLISWILNPYIREFFSSFATKAKTTKVKTIKAEKVGVKPTKKANKPTIKKGK